MRKLVLIAAIAAAPMMFSSPSWAFQCPSEFNKAKAAITTATTAMKAMGDKRKKGLVHTLLDDAKMILASARHNHKKPAAGSYDHARSIAKAKTATGYAETATMLAAR